MFFVFGVLGGLALVSIGEYAPKARAAGRSNVVDCSLDSLLYPGRHYSWFRGQFHRCHLRTVNFGPVEIGIVAVILLILLYALLYVPEDAERWRSNMDHLTASPVCPRRIPDSVHSG